MAKAEYLTKSDALNWVNGLPPNALIEGAPKPPSVGRVPAAHYRPISRDLSNLPRGERYVVRPVTSPKDGVIMLLPHEVVFDAETTRGPTALSMTREQALEERERLLREREQFLQHQAEWLSKSRELDAQAAQREAYRQKGYAEAAQAEIASRREAREAQKTIAELVQGLAEAETRAVEGNANAEIARQVGFFGNRMVDLGILWRLKAKASGENGLGFDDLVKAFPDEWKRAVPGFLMSDRVPKVKEGEKPDGLQWISSFLSYMSAERAKPEEHDEEDEEQAPPPKERKRRPKKEAKDGAGA